jgi:hypothetical protein
MTPNLDENSRALEAARTKKVRIFVSQMCVLSLASGIENSKNKHCSILGPLPSTRCRIAQYKMFFGHSSIPVANDCMKARAKVIAKSRARERARERVRARERERKRGRGRVSE